MSAFKNAVTNTPTMAHTANGAVTFASSLNGCVDLFFLIGASRKNPKQAVDAFAKAFSEEPDLAVRVLQYARDVLGGAGERNVYRKIVEANLESIAFAKYIIPLMFNTPKIGRWDDILVFLKSKNPEVRAAVGECIMEGLSNEQTRGLAAKWMPRNGEEAAELRRIVGMSPKQWRKTLVNFSDTVEQKMCAGQFDKINYNHVPSVAARRYQKAFNKQDAARYADYRNLLVKAVTTGVPTGAKINAAAVYPHDIIRVLRGRLPGDKAVSFAQWESLPNLAITEKKVLGLIDVSSSMDHFTHSSDYKGTDRLSPMDVSIGLGLYIADKQTGPLKDLFMTFQTNPEIRNLTGNIQQKIDQLARAPWGGSTNLQAAFSKILDYGRRNRLAASDMPELLVIISDMEFNSACGNNTNYEAARAQYRAAGYEMPAVLFWNVNGRKGNVPVTQHAPGVGLVSGFSPAILASVLGSTDEFTPRGIMLKAVMKEKYDI